LISPLSSFISHLYRAAKKTIRRWIKPDNHTLFTNIAADLTRSKAELILENTFLRQQLIILECQAKRPKAKPCERVLLVLPASRLRTWKQALLIVQPDTLIRWHRDIYCWLWKHKSESRSKPGRKPLLCSAVILIQRMALSGFLVADLWL
jgi:putative transposase